MFNYFCFGGGARGAVCVFETDKVYCQYRSWCEKNQKNRLIMKKGHVEIL